MKSTRAIRIITSLSLGVVILASLSWVGLGQVSGQISRIDVFGKLTDRPEKTSRALNYLVVGSDSREGLSKEEIRALRVGSTAVAAGGRTVSGPGAPDRERHLQATARHWGDPGHHDAGRGAKRPARAGVR